MKSKSIVICIMLLAAATSYGAQYAVDGNTLALWHMDENTGTIIYDETTTNADGTFVGGANIPTWSTGRYGASGVQLNVDRVFPIPSEGAGIDLAGSSLTNRNDFTFQTNFKWDGGTGFVNPGDNFAGYLYYDFDSFGVRIHQNNAQMYIKTLHRFGNGWNELNFHPGTTGGSYLDAGVWYDMAFTREKINATQTEIKIIIEGVGETSMIFNATSFNTGADLSLGHIVSGTSYTVDGEIDETRILDYAIPEPATLALLSLGGLFLRRRK